MKINILLLIVANQNKMLVFLISFYKLPDNFVKLDEL